MARLTWEVLKHYVETINEQGRNLTSWERKFMESITEQIDEGRTRFSENQEAHIERIYSERT